MAHTMPELLSLECWGGATFDVALRFLHEDPWERLEAASRCCPEHLLADAASGPEYGRVLAISRHGRQNFVAEAATTGIDIFRVFDAFNDIEQMRPAIDACSMPARSPKGRSAIPATCRARPRDLYTLDYYLGVAEKLDAAGVHILCIKDMAGLLRATLPARSSGRCVSASATRSPPHPRHVRWPGRDADSGHRRRRRRGRRRCAPAVGDDIQPSIAAVVSMTDDTARQSGLSLDAIGDLEPYWEAVRRVYRPFEAGLQSPTGTVYRHEIPGGQLSNLRSQATALGLGHRFEEVERLYAACNELLGRPIKVTPSSKVVGDLALHLVASGVTPEQLLEDPATVDLPDSVVGFLHGELGTPPGGFPEPFRTKAIQGRVWEPMVEDLSPTDVAGLASDDRRATLNRLLFPVPAAARVEQRDRFGDLSVLPSTLFWYGLDTTGEDTAVGLGKGLRVLLALEAIGEPDDDGMRHVIFRVNGHSRPIDTRDFAVASDRPVAERTDPTRPGHVGAPFRGVVNVSVAVGDEVRAGDAVAAIEAMKMESSISSPIDGTIERIVTAPGASLEPGDLILEIRPSGLSGSPETHIEN